MNKLFAFRPVLFSRGLPAYCQSHSAKWSASCSALPTNVIPGYDIRQVYITSLTLSRREYMDGRDTLHDSPITDGLKVRQSGHHENGQSGREDLKQDGETTLSATWVLREQE